MNAARPILAFVLLAACSNLADQSTPAADSVAVTSAHVGAAMDGFSRPAATLAPATPPAARRTFAEKSATPTRPYEQVSAASQTVASSMIIRNANVTIQVESIEPAIERLRAMAASLGGMVGQLTMNTGEHQVRSATLELKIPAARFDSAMTGMPALGKVEHSNTHAIDVGEEFVDITARVSNARRLEDRLVKLLANRTGKLEDVLAVERELGRVREEIERHEGRIRFLSARVATSSIHATVHEKAPIIAAQPGQGVFARAFLNMWRNFIGVLTAGIELLGVLIPIAAAAGVVYLAWRRWGKHIHPPQVSP